MGLHERQLTQEACVAQACVELADTLVDGFDTEWFVDRFLEHLATRCSGLLGVTACGVVIAGEHSGEPGPAAASCDAVRELERLEARHRTGPCVEAQATGRAVRCDDLRRPEARERWPRFAVAACDAGFTSVRSVPMRRGERRVGALSLLGAAGERIDDSTVTLAQTLADAAGVGIVHRDALIRQEKLTRQLQEALESRVVIEQAKGFLAQRLGLPVDDAFTVMRRYARSCNDRLKDIADGIISGDLDAGLLTAAATSTATTAAAGDRPETGPVTDDAAPPARRRPPGTRTRRESGR